MARYTITGLDEIMGGLNVFAENMDEVGKAAVDAAKPLLRDALSESVTQMANRGYATGALAASIKAGPTKQSDGGYYAEAMASGRDKDGTRNAEKLAYLEYGTGKQLARPVMQTTLNRAKEPCQEAMAKVIQDALNGAL